MPLIQMFGHMGLLSSIFTPVNILFFLLYLAAGLLLYLAIASIGGAIASKQEDLSMTNGIFVIVLLLSFFATLGTGSFSGNFDSASSTGFHLHQSLFHRATCFLVPFPLAKPAVPSQSWLLPLFLAWHLPDASTRRCRCTREISQMLSNYSL